MKHKTSNYDHLVGEESDRQDAQYFNEQRALNMLIIDGCAEVRAKLEAKHAAGARGWDDPQWSINQIKNAIKVHLHKGDPIDVIALALFWWNRLDGKQEDEGQLDLLPKTITVRQAEERVNHAGMNFLTVIEEGQQVQINGEAYLVTAEGNLGHRLETSSREGMKFVRELREDDSGKMSNIFCDCPKCGRQNYTETEIEEQIADTNTPFKCPVCGGYVAAKELNPVTEAQRVASTIAGGE